MQASGKRRALSSGKRAGSKDFILAKIMTGSACVCTASESGQDEVEPSTPVSSPRTRYSRNRSTRARQLRTSPRSVAVSNVYASTGGATRSMDIRAKMASDEFFLAWMAGSIGK